ncbi:MAG: hypothetical protein F4210_13945 [Holophagales bacterium]|nr:hypothetical protein [Holophagales bacterium]MYF96583.1 hypothetical protein [Holophagales bacterium]
MTDEKHPDDSVEVVESLISTVNDVQCELRQAGHSLAAARRLLKHPPEMAGPHSALVKRNLVKAADVTAANPNAGRRLGEAKTKLKSSAEQLDAAVTLIRKLTDS